MEAKIDITKIWSDDDMVEFSLRACDGESLFSNKIYVGHQYLKDVVRELNVFKGQIGGGLYDLRFGNFGPEYGSGALHARMHFQHGKIFITLNAQSEFVDFGQKRVASEATLFLIARPDKLEDFMRALQAVSDGMGDTATLNALTPY